MRHSPRLSEEEGNALRVKRDRRRLRAAVVGVGLVSVASIWASTSISRPDTQLPLAFARITGTAGSASGVAVSESVVVTDGTIFRQVGDPVAVLFGAGSEFRGVVVAHRTSSDGLVVALVFLLDGGVAPGSVLPGVLGDSEGVRGMVVCVSEEGDQKHAKLDLGSLQEERLPAFVSECGPGAAVVSGSEARDLLALFLSAGRGPRLRLLPIENVQVP